MLSDTYEYMRDFFKDLNALLASSQQSLNADVTCFLYWWVAMRLNYDLDQEKLYFNFLWNFSIQINKYMYFNTWEISLSGNRQVRGLCLRIRSPRQACLGTFEYASLRQKGRSFLARKIRNFAQCFPRPMVHMALWRIFLSDIFSLA